MSQSDTYQNDVDPNAATLIDTRIEDFISMGQLVESTDWIQKNVCSQGKGFEMALAQLIGWANVTKRQTNMVPGKPDGIESIKLSGEFEAVSLITGQVTQAPHAFLPKKWAQLVEVAVSALDLERDPSARVKMILTVGVRATGKTIPYAWTVATRLPRSSPDLNELRAIAAGAPAPRLLAGHGRTIDA